MSADYRKTISEEELLSKRQFLKQVLLGAAGAYMIAPLYAFWRYLVSPSEQRMPLAPVYLPELLLKEKDHAFMRFGHKSILIRQEHDGSVSAFNLRCSHAGCTVEWRADAEKFVCPCHGAEFHRDGSVAKLPATQPLEQLTVRTEGAKMRLFDEVYHRTIDH